MTGLTTMMPVLFFTRLLEGSSTAASIPSTLGFIAAETAHDEKLRGRVVSLFELVSLGGMLAVGPALSGCCGTGSAGRPSSSTACCISSRWGCTATASRKCHERGRPVSPDETKNARSMGCGATGVWPPATACSSSPQPGWRSTHPGLWALQAPLLLKGNVHDPSQFLMQGVSASAIGLGEAILAVVFGAGLLFWGAIYARFRRTTMLLFGVGAFAVLAVDVVLINHLGGVSVGLLCAFVGVGLVALFVLSGATPRGPRPARRRQRGVRGGPQRHHGPVLRLPWPGAGDRGRVGRNCRHLARHRRPGGRHGHPARDRHCGAPPPPVRRSPGRRNRISSAHGCPSVVFRRRYPFERRWKRAGPSVAVVKEER